MSENKENKEKKGKEWKFDDFKIGKSIGKGRFGSVYVAKEKKSSYVVGMTHRKYRPGIRVTMICKGLNLNGIGLDYIWLQ